MCTSNKLKINLQSGITAGNINIHSGSLPVPCCQEGFCRWCINSLLSLRVGLTNFWWCMTIPDRKWEQDPLTVLWFQGVVVLSSWLCSVGSVTVYTSDTRRQGRGSKIRQRCPVLRTSQGVVCPLTGRIWTNTHIKTQTGNVPPFDCAALDSVMKGKKLARTQISERYNNTSMMRGNLRFCWLEKKNKALKNVIKAMTYWLDYLECRLHSV